MCSSPDGHILPMAPWCFTPLCHTSVVLLVPPQGSGCLLTALGTAPALLTGLAARILAWPVVCVPRLVASALHCALPHCPSRRARCLGLAVSIRVLRAACPSSPGLLYRARRARAGTACRPHAQACCLPAARVHAPGTARCPYAQARCLPAARVHALHAASVPKSAACQGSCVSAGA